MGDFESADATDVRSRTRELAIGHRSAAGRSTHDRQASVQFLRGDNWRDGPVASEFSGAAKRRSNDDEGATRET
jgi:hypothetical protein